MAEIPSFVWVIVGLFVAGFSFFIGFIRNDSGFFKMMFFVGLGMIAFGGIKIVLRNRTKQNMIDEMRKRHAQRGARETEIDIDDYRRQGATQPAQRQEPANQKAQTHNKHKGKSGFCSQCGTPLLKHHKFCPICGARV